MRSSDLYFYAASILWIVWILYIGGFFAWAASLYFRMTYYFTFIPPPPQPTAPVETKKLADLIEIWSPSSKMPGVWSSENEESDCERVAKKDKDVVVMVEGGFMLV